MIRKFAVLSGMIAIIGLAQPVGAAPVDGAPSCLSALGDIWGENEVAVPAREIDGASIRSPAEFMRVTGTREAGLKIIRGGNFSGWDFSHIPLSHICFQESSLAGSNFTGANAPNTGFIKSDLSGASLRGANMPGILFRDAGLKNVSAPGADFSGGHFDGGWFEGSIEGWNIDGANLTGFTFDCGITLSDGCPVYQGGDGISAKGTDFSQATVHSFGLYDADLEGAILDQTIIGPGQLPYLAAAEFRGDIILRGGDSDVRVETGEARQLLAENARQKAADARPSFDCTRAASKVEQEICGEYADDLRLADRDVAALYQRAKAVDSGVRASQLDWLKQRNLCATAEYPSDCIRDSYDRRKGELLGLLGETAWLAPGESALFIDDVLPLPAAFRQSDLFDRIMPVLAGASMSEILVERAGDGLYAIRGSAVGANAHLCSLSAPYLYFDKASGWYIPVSEGPAIPIFRIFDGRLEIFANGKPDYEKYPEASDFMSCGMRASFGPMIRIDADDALIDRYRKSLNEEM